MTRRAERIEALLKQHFHPDLISVIDESAHHAGHAGAAPEGETHFAVTMVAEGFRGQNRVARSRSVHALLSREFETGLHALSLTLRAPGENAA